MSDQAFVVMPVGAGGARQQDMDEVAAAISRVPLKTQIPEHHEESQPQDGPLKKVLASQDSLYKYISWEDPGRTIGSYLGLLGVLVGTHYLHPTQLALKLAAFGLGGVSLVSSASRLTKNDFAAQLRPEYKQVPEPTLNATLKDIHDFIQYSVIQLQKIVYGEDLQKTFAAFVGVTALFLLSKFLTPFGLAILGLTALYVTPLVNSPRGREVARDVKVRAQDVANTTAENATIIAQASKNKASELSTKAQQTAGDLSSRAQQTAGNVAGKAQQTAGDLSSRAQETAGNAASKAQDTAHHARKNIGQVAQNGQQTAANTYNQAKSTAADYSNGVNETASNLSYQARNTTSDAYGSLSGNSSNTTHSTSDDPQQYLQEIRSGTDNGQQNNSVSGQYEIADAGQKTSLHSNVAVDGVIPRYDQTRI